MLDFVAVAKSRQLASESVCIDLAPGGAVETLPWITLLQGTGMISKWWKKRDFIYTAALDESKKRLKGGGHRRSRESGRWSVMENRLHERFAKLRRAPSPPP